MGKKRHGFRAKQPNAAIIHPHRGVVREDVNVTDPGITIYRYDEHSFEEVTIPDPHLLREHLDKHPDAFSWIRITGVQPIEWIQEIVGYYKVNPIVVDNIKHGGKRPKHETFPHLDLILFNLLLHPDVYQEQENIPIETEQMTMLIFDRCLVSIQETGIVSFNSIVMRIKQPGSRHRRLGPDYLANSILDVTVDHYMLTLEMIGNQLQFLESQILDDLSYNVQLELHDIRMKLIMIRKYFIPMREAIWSIYRGGSPQVREATRPFMKDVHDHMATVVETLEYTREIVANLADTYNYVLNNRMNQIMKLLTIISTIFMPLTFIVGVYGMNFDVNSSPWNMPELTWKWGYLTIWGIMILTSISMISYIKRRNWL